MKFFRYSNAIAALCCMFLLGACKDSNDGIPDWPWEGDTDEKIQGTHQKTLVLLPARSRFHDAGGGRGIHPAVHQREHDR